MDFFQKRPSLLLVAWSVIATLLFFSTGLFAASVSTSLGQSASVVADCKVTNSPMIRFGSYNSGSGNTATGSIAVECVAGTNATVGLDQGTNVNNLGGCTTTRAMDNQSGSFLCYDLYTSASYSTVWSTTTTVPLDFTSLATMTTTVYGKVPSGQSPAVGAYLDFVGVIVSF